MSRHGGALLCLLVVCPLSPLAAQDALEAQSGSPPERIDIRVEQEINGPEYEDCSDEQEAAEITGEIVVCRRKNDDTAQYYDKQAVEKKIAERTQGQKPVDVSGPGIFKGPATVSGLCFIPPCPADPVLMIDVQSLPEAPPGSDADRLARGLAPRGYDHTPPQAPQSVREPGFQENAALLGLPPVSGAPASDSALNPSGSASPAEGQQDSQSPPEEQEPS